MENQVGWLVEDRVINWKVAPSSTLEELSAVNSQINTMMNNSAVDTIYTMVDITDLKLGSSFLSANQLQKSIDFHKHPKWQSSIAYGNTNRSMTVMVQFIANIWRSQLYFDTDQQSAYNHLRRLEPSLPVWEETLA